MAIEATITGNLGADPDVRWTQGGQQVTELRICATPRRQRRGPDGKPSGEWEDAGAPPVGVRRPVGRTVLLDR